MGFIAMFISSSISYWLAFNMHITEKDSRVSSFVFYSVMTIAFFKVLQYKTNYNDMAIAICAISLMQTTLLIWKCLKKYVLIVLHKVGVSVEIGEKDAFRHMIEYENGKIESIQVYLKSGNILICNAIKEYRKEIKKHKFNTLSPGLGHDIAGNLLLYVTNV